MSARRRWVRRAPLGVLLVLGLLVPAGGSAQLISPGKLSAPHAQLEGIRNCTQCHELRKKGASQALCLGCHTPLATRIEAREGYHASLTDQSCATCHKEHFGVDFQLVRLDTAAFDHEATGFALEGRHQESGCRDCHAADHVTAADVLAEKREHGSLDRTFLGLPTACASCHEADTPHDGQFARRACTDCHDAGGWEGAKEFDHDRAPFRLTGRHQSVDCAQCHQTTPRGDRPPVVRYEGVTADRCTDCHQDQHEGAMPGRCERCHNTGGWTRVDRGQVERSFDHATTGFSLEGHHAQAPCASCHDRRVVASEPTVSIAFQAGTEARAFPRPRLGDDGCLACHVDLHRGEFTARTDGGNCQACHGEDAWLPSAFDAARHDRETSFVLKGAHLVVPCSGCHEAMAPDDRPASSAPDFHLAASTCLDCHQQRNPHGTQFEGRSCSACHNTTSFRIESFDHDATRFPLDGAHRRASCDACHKATGHDSSGTPVVVYRPLGLECRDCHGGEA